MSSQVGDISPVAIYTLRIERDKLDRLREIAASEHRSISGELKAMIDARIQASDDESVAA